MAIPEISAFAQEENTMDLEDIILSEEEFNAILENNINTGVEPYATGLIQRYEIGITKSNNNIVIAGRTVCSASVVKCGFKEVIIQRRTSASSSWSNYLTYKDLYADATQYILSKTVSVPSGYQYRVTCKHYAKKNILSTQTISNTSNILIF